MPPVYALRIRRSARIIVTFYRREAKLPPLQQVRTALQYQTYKHQFVVQMCSYVSSREGAALVWGDIFFGVAGNGLNCQLPIVNCQFAKFQFVPPPHCGNIP